MAPHVFMTGGSGQVGAFVVRELLAKGCEVSLLVRGARPEERIARILGKIGVDAGACRIIAGDLDSATPSLGKVDAFLHLAAELSFDESCKDEVWRVNYQGTANVLGWAKECSAGSFHYVSTAYVAGYYEGPYDESCMDVGQSFHNEYEKSKLATEKLCREFCNNHAIPCNVYRPGIVMGETGGTTLQYQGYYVFFKVLWQLKERYLRKGDSAGGIHERDGILHMPLRIEARAEGRKHVVPVDYVARSIAALALQPTSQPGETLFLLPPHPPTNLQMLEWTQRALNVSGLSLVETSARQTSLEKLIAAHIKVYRSYLQQEPNFRQDYSLARLEELGIVCSPVNYELIRKWVEYGIADNWGRNKPFEPGKSDAHPYFCDFLARFLGQPVLPGLSTLTSRFAVRLQNDGGRLWRMDVEKGILLAVDHVAEDAVVDFIYDVSDEIFRRMIAAEIDPRGAFFAGKTDIRGNMEQGLKVANVLRSFFRLHPYVQ